MRVTVHRAVRWASTATISWLTVTGVTRTWPACVRHCVGQKVLRQCPSEAQELVEVGRRILPVDAEADTKRRRVQEIVFELLGRIGGGIVRDDQLMRRIVSDLLSLGPESELIAAAADNERENGVYELVCADGNI